MASFSAELQVAGQRYSVRYCSYEFTQATSERGRVSAKVRHGLVHLTLDVPDDDALLGWAATPHKPLAGQVLFFDGKSGPVLEALAWEAGECVGYQEVFVAGSLSAGAYVCHLTIAAAQLRMQPGGPAAYVSPAAREHGAPAAATATVLDAALLQAEELATGLVKKVITPAGELGTEILGVGAAALARTASLTLGLVLTPTNSRDDDGYKSEWDMGKLTQLPTDKDRARLDYLEKERESRTLSEAEEDELATLLALVRKVFVGGRNGLPLYYAQQVKAARIAAQARAVDTSRGGHSYAEHGAHVTAAQHEVRLRTGQKPSGDIPRKADGTLDIPSRSASFDSDEKYLETLRLADQQLPTEQINSKGGLKKKVDFDVLGTTNTGKAYELDPLGNVLTIPVQGARAAYRLNAATGQYELITLFPK
ncbi:MAG: type VI secretion system tube protein TssD [Janthinobacterium lividum]